MRSPNGAEPWGRMEATEIAAYAGMTAAALAIIGLAVKAIYSMAKLTQEVQALKETVGIELRAHKEAQSLELQAHKEAQSLELQALEQRMSQNHQVLRSDIQRLFDAMASHTHDTDGAVIFRIPATPQSEPEESPAD